MSENKISIKWASLEIATLLVTVLLSCKTKDSKPSDIEKFVPDGLTASIIHKMEDFIPAYLSDTNYIVIWRTGSDYYYSDFLSALIIEKKQLKDTQILCHYMTFDPNKPSNYRNWKFANLYELIIENSPFKYPPSTKTSFNEIDSIILKNACHRCITSNVYFMKNFKSNEVFPINHKYNSDRIKNIVKLFEQISKKEKVQTFALTKDTIDYKELYRFCHEPEQSREYCIMENGNVSDQQRLYGDK